MPKHSPISQALKTAIDALPSIDIPAKGRIAHHIRTGRIPMALSLCTAGQLFIWQHIWVGARPILLEQLNRLKQVEALLLAEVGRRPVG